MIWENNLSMSNIAMDVCILWHSHSTYINRSVWNSYICTMSPVYVYGCVYKFAQTYWEDNVHIYVYIYMYMYTYIKFYFKKNWNICKWSDQWGINLKISNRLCSGISEKQSVQKLAEYLYRPFLQRRHIDGQKATWKDAQYH